MPIPGAAVSAANAATKETIIAWTDVDGSYQLRIPADGPYTLQVQMSAFAASTRQVVFDATHQDVPANFELILLSGNARRTTNSGRPMPAADVVFKTFPCFRVVRGGCSQRLLERCRAIGYAGARNCVGQCNGICGGCREHFQFIQCHER